MFRKLSYTWELMRASWDVLKQDKELLVFPLVSGICCLLVLASFAVPIWYTGNWQPPRGQANWQRQFIDAFLLDLAGIGGPELRSSGLSNGRYRVQHGK